MFVNVSHECKVEKLWIVTSATLLLCLIVITKKKKSQESRSNWTKQENSKKQFFPEFLGVVWLGLTNDYFKPFSHFRRFLHKQNLIVHVLKFPRMDDVRDKNKNMDNISLRIKIKCPIRIFEKMPICIEQIMPESWQINILLWTLDWHYRITSKETPVNTGKEG